MQGYNETFYPYQWETTGNQFYSRRRSLQSYSFQQVTASVKIQTLGDGRGIAIYSQTWRIYDSGKIRRGHFKPRHDD